MSAVPLVNGSEKHYVIVAVLGSRKANQNLQNALETNAQILDQVRPQFKLFTLTPPANGYGKITTQWHMDSDLEVKEPIQIFGYPGMEVAYSIDPLAVKLPVAPGMDAATLKIETEGSSQTVSMTNTVQIDRPGFLWRLLRN